MRLRLRSKILTLELWSVQKNLVLLPRTLLKLLRQKSPAAPILQILMKSTLSVPIQKMSHFSPSCYFRRRFQWEGEEIGKRKTELGLLYGLKIVVEFEIHGLYNPYEKSPITNTEIWTS